MTSEEKDMQDLMELKSRVSAALTAMNRFDSYSKDIKENEIKFRYESIVGILLMAQNDIFGMIREWKRE